MNSSKNFLEFDNVSEVSGSYFIVNVYTKSKIGEPAIKIPTTLLDSEIQGSSFSKA